MVNEIAEGNNDKSETEQWTIRLGKYVTYNPSPFRSREDFLIKTVACIFLVGLGIVMLLYPNLPIQIIGGLTLGSMLFCYILSIYETQLYDKRFRHELR